MKIYKVCSLTHWQAAKANGVFTGESIDITDGYIHFSTSDQLAKTLSLHFAGQTDLVLLSVETDKIGTDVKWEKSRGGSLFPHLYADLSLDAIVAEHELKTDADGVFVLPEGL
ncbi:DUF952 domain-containing protein [Maritalea sp.]|uniref:DUF952 domain-containing protein n=1 Tax=Maritalea sp. TaxID=2003361 RepID=UPI003EF2602D